MNNSKTEFIVFGSKKMLHKLETDILNVNGESVKISEDIKYFRCLSG